MLNLRVGPGWFAGVACVLLPLSAGTATGIRVVEDARRCRVGE